MYPCPRGAGQHRAPVEPYAASPLRPLWRSPGASKLLPVTIMERAYGSLGRAVRWVAPLFAGGDSKLARGVRARRHAARRLVDWARVHRDPRRPLLWIHAPSVGEGLQARAVVQALLERVPDLQVVFTHFSPSAEALAPRMPADVADTLPWDVPADAGRAAAELRPDVLVFTKTELWPVLAGAARGVGSRTALVAATLPAASSRLRWPSRAVLWPTLAALDLVAAVAEPDAERLRAVGARDRAIHVTGDPGVDSAAQRAAAADPTSRHLRPFVSSDRPTLVAGSTWPPDEAVLVLACLKAHRSGHSLRVIVAPHEPNEEAVRALEARFAGAGWRAAKLGEVEARGEDGGVDVVVVDRVGVLADLYTVGDVAWVGGGFHGAGLHSVLEPAAAGLPVLMGPHHSKAPAAAALVERGGARVVRDAGEATAALTRWLADPVARTSAGAAAQGYIEAHRGAAARSAALVAELLSVDGAR